MMRPKVSQMPLRNVGAITSFLGYDMINYLKNDSSLTQDDVFVKESPVNHRRPTVNDDYPECRTRYSFHAEFDGCLTVQKGQILFLQRHNNDGWSLGNGFEPTVACHRETYSSNFCYTGGYKTQTFCI